MEKYTFYFVLFLVIVLPSQTLIAQSESEDVTTNSQYWLDYNMKYSINEKKSVSGFVGLRTIDPHIYTKLVLVPTYNIRHLKSLKFLNLKDPFIDSFHLGGGLFYTNNLDKDDNFEFRLMQGFQIFTPEIKGVFIKNYVRLEERFQKTINDDYEWSTGLRMRYKISTVFELKKKGTTFEKGLYLPASIELFYSIKETDRFNDKIRISAGIGYKLNTDWRFELSASYHNTKNTSEDNQTTNDFVFRLRLFKSNIKKGIFIHDKEGQIKEMID